MLKDKLKELTLENYIDDEKTIEEFFEAIEDDNIPDYAYQLILKLMREFRITSQLVAVLTSYLGSKNLIEFTPDGVMLKDYDKNNEAKEILQEGYMTIKPVSINFDRLEDFEQTLLAVMYINGLFAKVKEHLTNEDNADLDDFELSGKEVQ